MSESTTPPLVPILIPDSPGNDGSKPKRTSKPKPAVVPLAAKTPDPPPIPQKPEPQRFTLADAFDYFEIPDDDYPSESELNNERCVRAVAFLLHYCSEHGNEPIEGFAAHGLAKVLEKCAAYISHVKAHREWLKKNEPNER
jgi:hypothetical protein